MTTPRKRPVKERPSKERPLIGWREWALLEGLDLPPIKVKIDTGARSSALHATRLKTFERDGQTWAAFTIHPLQRTTRQSQRVEMPVVEFRRVRSSNGQETDRPVVRTPVVIGQTRWILELTLADRDAMGFRMLLGRQAMRKRFQIDPGKSYLQGIPQEKDTP
ncbi:ATP-dependent zinc protease family protein [Roseimaritima sediminicola]|uniref:ATP-dependent zinc protease family protein n=1 Tax=Roseimaritima sediminicola TaxID=2662066 RepID=UPI0012983A44|nr:RimK/LysX family protein [Roseimaritima sediminicola]